MKHGSPAIDSEAYAMPDETEKVAMDIAPWLAVIFSALAAVAGLWTALETRSAAHAALDANALDSRTALVRTCQIISRRRFVPGDDIMRLNGNSQHGSEYNSAIEQDDFDNYLPKRPTDFLRCLFTNYSRVPLLTVGFFLRVDYHKHRVHRTEKHFPFAGLGPTNTGSNSTRVVWFVNTSNEPIAVSIPDRARHARFPELSQFQDQLFEPVLKDYWVLTRDADAVENLDQSMM